MNKEKIVKVVIKNNIEYFILIFSYDTTLVNYIRQIPLRKFNAKEMHWEILANHVTAKYVKAFCNKFEFVYDDLYLNTINKYSNIDVLYTENDIPKFKRELRDFQKNGLLYILPREKCLIGDQMGLGKTITSIAFVETKQAYPSLVICPSTLKLNWKREIENTLYDKKIVIIDGFYKDDIKYDYNADFIIINYDILKANPKEEYLQITNHYDILKKIKFKSLICDESQYLINPKSNRTKAVKAISRKIPYKLLLSGTPIMNRPKELIPQLDILDMLDYFGGFMGFATKYCDLKQTPFGMDISGASNLLDLNTKLKEYGYIRRTSEEVLKELPEKQRVYIPISISSKDKQKYNEISKNFISWLKNNLLKSDERVKFIKENQVISEELKKKMIQNVINLKVDKVKMAETLVKIEKLKQTIADIKYDYVKPIIDNFLENKQKLVIFCSHKSIHQKLIKDYKNICVHIAGGMTTEEKQLSVDQFMNNDKVKLFVGEIKSSGVGITLTASDTVLFLELEWTPAIHQQAEHRVYRIGQRNFVSCYYFYVEDTIDNYILDILKNKENIYNESVDGIPSTISNDENFNIEGFFDYLL